MLKKGDEGMSKNRSMKYQAQGILKPMLRLGESRQKAKQDSEDRQHVEGIFSTSTYNNYVTVADHFGRWAKAAYGEKNLVNCRKYVSEYLKMRIDKGLSPDTVKRDVSALAKLYGCTKDDFGVDIPKMSRSEITRSRKEVKEFDYEKHKALLDFINGTSHRRSELLNSKKENYIEVNGEIIVRIKGKGGKIRYSKVLPQFRELVRARLEGLKDGDKVFKKGEIPVRTPCHAYWAKYAKDYYNMIARPLDSLSAEDKYICRKDKAGTVYDRKALAEVSKMLGHNRLSVVVDHYLY